MKLREVIHAIRAWERLTLVDETGFESEARYDSLCAQCLHPLYEHRKPGKNATRQLRRSVVAFGGGAEPCTSFSDQTGTACRCANFGRLWAVALGFRK